MHTPEHVGRVAVHLFDPAGEVLEHLFVGDLLRCLWRLGRRDIELLRAEVDYAGYDLLLECNGHVRHIQLKFSHRNSSTNSVNAHVGLIRKPSACIIWIQFDPNTMELGPFLWFGSNPGEPLSVLSDRVARHTKANRTGKQGLRSQSQSDHKNSFRELASIEQVARALFGIGEEAIAVQVKAPA